MHNFFKQLWRITALVSLLISFGHAHPGYGVAVDSRGNIYFTDISRQTIWKIDAHKNLHAIATGKWSHQLWIDADDNIYFTNEENISGKSGYSFWQCSPEGNLTMLIEPSPRADFPSDIFAISADGDLLVANNTTLYRWENDRHLQPVALGDAATGDAFVGFAGILSLTLDDSGHICLVDGDKLRRIRNGAVETICENLILENPPHLPVKNAPNPRSINRLFGIAPAPDGTIYLAYFGNRQLLKLTPDGETVVFYTADAPWSPVGCAIDEQGIIVKEHAFTEESGWQGPRIVRLNPSGVRETIITLE